MGHGGWAVCGLALCSALVALNYEHSPVFERPTQSSIILFFICGILVLLLFIVIPRRIQSSAFTDGYSLFPFRDRALTVSPKDLNLTSLSATDLLTTRNSIVLLLPAAGAIFLRVELFRLVLRNRQCSLSGTEGFVLFLVAIYDYLYIQNRYPPTVENIHDTGLKPTSHGKARYVLPAALLSVAGILTSFGTDDVRSTYICPQLAGKVVPILQIIGVLLDSFVLISIENVLRIARANNAGTSVVVPKVVGSVFLLSAAIQFLGGFIAFVTHPGQWPWVLGIDKGYISSLTWYTLLLTIATMCCIESYREYGLVQPVSLVTFICTYFSGFQKALMNQRVYINTPQTANVLSLVFLFLGAALFLHVASLGSSTSFKPTHELLPRIPPFAYMILIGLLIVRSLLQLPRGNIETHHPIDLLINDASSQFQTWLAQATTSKTLLEAAATYRLRYKRHPPPGFDTWYQFATEKSSLIIDDFDSIMEDLHPFWARHPINIRHDTRVILSDEWNEVAEITIRSGKAKVGPNVIPTHRWMLDGVLAMMDDFVQWLPDMDLAFNINDEPRVAVPWKAFQGWRQAGTVRDAVKHGMFNEWSSNRAETWEPSVGTKESKRPFENRSFLNSFASYGIVACPPTSLARTSHLWDPRNLCITCAAPHSLGLFLQNWTLSASPCHQPDLAHLHGFYLSPAAFKPSHKLLPVFSQSKAHGYADILYPSAWNYMDKVKYEPSEAFPDAPFESKQNSLFWRGATSEGLSKDATWKGMARQRLVHLANNATEALPILMPHPLQPSSFTYNILPASSLPAMGPNLDIAIVDDIARCWDADCTDQANEFGLVGKSDFQAHWGYRFLMDLDGAGFSGRFLPFLRSRSVVFKTAVFREWWDDRLTAWRHFVPVDIRFHGLFSTLAYFAGTGDGKDHGGKGNFPTMKPNVEAGARIAEESRQWADQVLRKEDMQIYMFRLLLEWGRLTDDRRDEIGFDE